MNALSVPLKFGTAQSMTEMDSEVPSTTQGD